MAVLGEHPTTVTTDESLDTQLALPAEIINIIIDVLGHDTNQPASISALGACALVSKALCIHAYSYLFSEIKLSIVPSSFVNDAPKELLDILVTGLRFPNLGMVYHIRSASFILKIKYQYVIQGNISDQTALPEIMDALHGPNHGISSFALEVDCGGQGQRLAPTWSDNGTKFNTAFQSLCLSRNLASLCLKGLKEVPKALLHGTNITQLILEDIDVGQHEEEMLPGHLDIVRPSSITLSLGRSSLPDIVEFLLGNANANADRSSRFRVAFTHLSDLTIAQTQNQRAYLHQMPHLRSFRLIHQGKYPGRAELVFLDVNKFFSYEENIVPPFLAHLTVEVRALESCFTELREMQEEGTKSQGWNTFDLHLTGSQFQSVRTIHLVIHLSGSYRESLRSHQVMSVAEIKETVLQNLSRLVALRPTTFRLDVVIDNFNLPRKVGKPGVRFRSAHSGWW